MKQYLFFPIYILTLLCLLLHSKSGYGQCPAPAFCAQLPTTPTISITGGSIVETRNVKVISESGRRIIDALNILITGQGGVCGINPTGLTGVALLPATESIVYSSSIKIPVAIGYFRQEDVAGTINYMRLMYQSHPAQYSSGYGICQPCWNGSGVEPNYLDISEPINSQYLLGYPSNISRLFDVSSIDYTNAFVAENNANCISCDPEACFMNNSCCNYYCYDHVSDDLPIKFNMKNGTSVIGYFKSAPAYKERKYLPWKKAGTFKKVAFNGSQTLTLAVNSPLANHTYQWNKPDGTSVAGTSISITQAGYYSVTATNSTGCKATSTEIIEAVQSFDIQPTITHVNPKNPCAASTAPIANQDLGSISLLVSPTTDTYTYLWKKNGIEMSGETTASISNLPEGTYEATITNQAGISRIATYTIGKRVSWSALGNNPPNRSFSDGDWIVKVIKDVPTVFPDINTSTLYFGWAREALDRTDDATKLHYAFALKANAFQVVEQGVVKSALQPFNANDQLKIKRVGTVVKYYLNEVEIPTIYSPINIEEPLYAAYSKVTGAINNIGVSFSPACADEQYNFIRTQVFQVAIKEGDDLTCAEPDEILTNTQYFDGLGRPIQSVAHNASPTQKDIVQFMAYDTFGRQVNSYLPYTATAQDICARYRTDALAEQATFYNSGTLVGVVADANPYSVTDFEASPLNRALRQFGVGTSWQGQVGITWNPSVTPATADKSVKTFNRGNIANEVRQWTKTGNTWSGTASYPTGELMVSLVYDEDNKNIKEFKDKEGKLIAKAVDKGTNAWVFTYYLYDDFNRLMYVIQPEGVNDFGNSAKNNSNPFAFTEPEATTQVNATIREEQMFQYKYDQRNRVVQKRIPGQTASSLFVYDRRDRVILSQEPRQATTNEWNVSKYDALNRPIMSQQYLAGSATQTTLQSDANNTNGLFEVKTTGANSANEYYTKNLAYPNTTASNTYALTYYDSYDYNNTGSYIDDFDMDLNGLQDASDVPDPKNPNDMLVAENSVYAKQKQTASTAINLYVNRGKMVVSRTRKLNVAANGAISYDPLFLLSAIFYDKYGRPIHTRADNIKATANSGSTGISQEISTNSYDFAGKLLSSRLRHRASVGTQANMITKEFTYDHVGRLIRSYSLVDGQEKVLTAQNTYNEMGQLVGKKNHSLDLGNSFMQDITYDYNIRGWLKYINKAAGTDPLNVSSSQQLFRFGLWYEDHSWSNKFYNGNISVMRWRGNANPNPSTMPARNLNLRRTYYFSYDKLNRLTHARWESDAKYTNTNYEEDYAVVGDGLWNNPAPGITYDDNGNIKTLKQNGALTFENASSYGNSYGRIDDLLYTYQGNKLMQVQDVVPTASNAQASIRGDFNDGTNTGNDYDYDASGNLTTDLNKGISITYNHLNLPILVQKNASNYLTYLYDGTGAKLKKTAVEAGVTTTTEYIGAFVYTSTATTTDYFMASEEGRIVNLAGQPFGSAQTYEYTYKDHLGNARLSYRQNPLAAKQSILMTAEAANRTAENTQFDNIAQAEDLTSGYASAASVKLNSTKQKVGNLKVAGGNGKTLNANSNSSVKVSVRAAWNTPPQVIQRMIAQAGGTVPEASPSVLPAPTPTNTLMMSSPIVVIPPQPQQSVGEIVIPPSPPRINLIGVAQLLKSTLSLQRKKKEATLALPTEIVPLGLRTAASSTPPPAAKLVVNLYVGASIVQTYEQPVTSAGETAWEELSIGFTTSQQVRVEAYVISTDSRDTWFDELKVEITAKPTAVVVQENHYSPFGLNMKGLDYTAPSPNTENKFTFNGQSEKETKLNLNWHETAFRGYDPQLGRFHQIDPLADFFTGITPFQFGYNNPILFNDPTGLMSDPGCQDCKSGMAPAPTPAPTPKKKNSNSAGGSGVGGGGGGSANTSIGGLVSVTVSNAYKNIGSGFKEYGNRAISLIKNGSKVALNGTNRFLVTLAESGSVRVLTPLFYFAEAMASTPNGGKNDRAIDYHNEFARLNEAYNRKRGAEELMEDENYEYFFRAMSYKEYNATGGNLYHTRGEPPFVTSELWYLLNPKSFIHTPKSRGSYDLIVMYALPKGTLAYWKSIGLDANNHDIEDVTQEAIRRGVPLFKNEKGSDNFGFGGNVGNILFNRQIQIRQVIWERKWGKL